MTVTLLSPQQEEILASLARHPDGRNSESIRNALSRAFRAIDETRSNQGKISFKAIFNKYLLKHGG